MSLKVKQQGFTIVELLIVIVVIGILAALVITTFTGIQQRARNTERETDIKAIHGQVEAYYAQNGRYPTVGNLNDDAWRSTNMKGLDEGALHAPNSTADVTGSATTATNEYSYIATPNGCDNTPTNGDCVGYTVEADKEGGGTYSKTALN